MQQITNKRIKELGCYCRKATAKSDVSDRAKDTNLGKEVLFISTPRHRMHLLSVPNNGL